MRKSLFHCLLVLIIILCSCGKEEKTGERGKDWDYTVVITEDCPKDLLEEIEKKKVNSFQMTYDDGEYLYIAVGYGEQQTGGYSIKVLGLYEQGDGLCIETSLLGPEEDVIVKNKASFPYIVIKTEKTEKNVTFL